MTRLRFDGDITGIGTSSGTRLVVGHWPSSHLGEFTDVMMEFADGHRVLLAPSEAVRDFVTTTYHFDETRIHPVTHSASGDTVTVVAGDLTVKFVVGGQTALGRLLGLVPSPIAVAPWFCTITDPIARVVLRGVRTRGTAGYGRREYYGARGQRRVVSAEVTWKGDDMGHLAPVTPPVTFGFGSTPAAPSTTRITTTIDE
ncbi:hypothetical protein [Rhodococcoides trifolii]|nr:hypothetical protein [Rhodococcus trifolii]